MVLSTVTSTCSTTADGCFSDIIGDVWQTQVCVLYTCVSDFILAMLTVDEFEKCIW